MWLLFIVLQAALAFDPLSAITDKPIREAVAKAQQDEINRRTGLSSTDCTELLADLPFQNGTKTPLHTSFATIQAMMIGIKYWDKQCLDQLVQNIITVNNPIAVRVAQELLGTDFERSINDEAIYCAPPQSDLEKILQLSKNVTGIQNCTPLTQGKWKIVNGTSKSRISYSYGLIQEAPKKIRAVLNVQFTGTQNGVTASMMQDRVRSCLSTIQSGLKGPNGDELAISIMTPQEVLRLPANLRPTNTNITIASNTARSNSKAYASSINCPTILHEILHLLGLCDEYPGEGDGYPCRAVGNRDSVMRNQNLIFDTALSENLMCKCETEECKTVLADPVKLALIKMPTYDDIIPTNFRNRYCEFNPNIYRRYFSPTQTPTQAYSANLESDQVLMVTGVYNPTATQFDEAPLKCECPADDEECKSSLRVFAQPPSNMRPRKCPDPTTLMHSAIGAPPQDDRFENGVLYIHRPALKPSLLEARHFNKIIAGNCAAQTARYEECAELAYETKKLTCEKAPIQCLNNTLWGQ